MCTTCGCADDQTITINGHSHGHTVHDHAHSHAHDHAREHGQQPAGEIIRLEQDLLAKNDHIAQHNREWFHLKGILALNILGSPGAGKTALLEATLQALPEHVTGAVVEGDQSTQHDAERIRSAGAEAVQVNTGAGCHLEADMLARGLHQLQPRENSVLFIENVGNLVCPALFDLGEAKRVVLLSITEGEDKPVKYPHMFRSADLLILNKSDLLPHLNFDLEQCMAYAREVRPDIEIITLSTQSGEGMPEWLAWIEAQQQSLAGQPIPAHSHAPMEESL